MLFQVIIDLCDVVIELSILVQLCQLSLLIVARFTDFTSLTVRRLQSQESFVQELVLLQGELLSPISFGVARLELAFRSHIEDVDVELTTFLARVAETKDETQEGLVLVQQRAFPFTCCVLSV